MSDVKMDDIVSLCKRRGFIYQGSEIYGGLAGTWDYGPLGVALKRNITNLWWKKFVEDRDDMYGVDAAILMNQKVWQASGHVSGFNDPLVECSNCKSRFRVDHLIQNEKKFKEIIDRAAYQFIAKHQPEDLDKLEVIDLKKQIDNYDFPMDLSILMASVATSYESKDLHNSEEIILQAKQAKSYIGNLVKHYITIEKINCPVCKKIEWQTPKQFNMMFKTHVGAAEDDSSISYLRPETAQGIFTNYKNVVDSFYPDLPFGIAQQGKAFRNEISPRDFVFRSREFEQMEIEYFIDEKTWEAEFEKWRIAVHEWLDLLGLPKDKVHELEVPADDLAHYSKRTIDFEFDYPHGRDELLGMAYRTNFDLNNVQRDSGKNMEYRPKDGSEAFVPHVIEPSFGVERAVMAVLVSAYKEDEVNGEKRIYLALPEHLAPVKYAVSPLLKNKPELVEKAREVYKMLKEKLGAVMWDDNGNIGKRYRRQDEIGTPYCIVIDFQTLEDNTVTIRNRDTTEQTRQLISGIIMFD